MSNSNSKKFKDEEDRYYISEEVFIYNSCLYIMTKNRRSYWKQKINFHHWLRLCRPLGWYPLHQEWIDLIHPDRKRHSYTPYGLSCYGNPSNYPPETLIQKCLHECFRWRDTPENNEKYVLNNPNYHFDRLHKVLDTLATPEKADSTVLIKNLSQKLQINIILFPHIWIYTTLHPYTFITYNSDWASVFIYHTKYYEDFQFMDYFKELIITHYSHSFLENHCQPILNQLVHIESLTECPPPIIPTFFGKPRPDLPPPPPKIETPPPPVVFREGTTLTW